MNGLKTAKELSENKPHGTRIKYLGGCRCVPCRSANSRYQSERKRQKKLGNWNGLVDASKARDYLHLLSENGIGRRDVCDISGVAQSVISKIYQGQRTNIRALTEKAILAVELDFIKDMSKVDAKPVWKMLSHLFREGFTHRSLAKRLGYKGGINLGKKTKKVSAKKARKIEKFYSQIFAE